MKELADGVFQLDGTPPNGINVYILGDVLIDAGTVFDKGRILKQIKGRELSAHALTHAHIDHYGASKAVCEAHGDPVLVRRRRCAEAVEAGKMVGPWRPDAALLPRAAGGQAPGGGRRGGGLQGARHARPLARATSPTGASPTGRFVCGDVMWGFNPFMLRGDIREPFAAFSPDPQLNRESARRLAALEPALVCFGHGPPLRDPAKFAAAVAKLS